MEVYVVDNISVDGSVQMVKQKFPQVNLIENKQNVGFSKANNQAIKIAKGRYVLLLNPDTVVEENTFTACVQFMDNHPDAGGLGVKMIDGKGKFLPESKRGLPTPEVAFYKIFGLSALFPKSKKFGQYHLGYLNNNETHEIDILSGAFMLMRKETLDKVGWLDEDFFMYGEDIDLSYRIQKSGYKNYYFPDTSIIHYKGESTKKSSVNYVFVFYNAMIIFAKKHFSSNHAKSFSFLINVAIYLRAGVAIVNRFVKKLLFPIFESLLIILAHWIICLIYQHFTGKVFQDNVLWINLPLYSFLYVLFTALSGGYDKPMKIWQVVRGVAIGAIIVFAIYGFLPKTVQFSRFILFTGSLSTVVVMLLTRWVLHLVKWKGYIFSDNNRKRFLVVGDAEESERIEHLVRKSFLVEEFVSISPSEEYDQGSYQGQINQLSDFVRLHKIDEVIFSAKNLSSAQIINLMGKIQAGTNVDYKIAQPDTQYLIGSNSIHTSGELYIMEINTIVSKDNVKNKRLLDLFFATVFLAVMPILMWFLKSPFGFLLNSLEVLRGKKTWVGYNANGTATEHLPKIKHGVIDCTFTLDPSDKKVLNKQNIIYAKDYSIQKDLRWIFKKFRQLGRR